MANNALAVIKERPDIGVDVTITAEGQVALVPQGRPRAIRNHDRPKLIAKVPHVG